MATINGNDFGNLLVGTNSADTIDGKGGDDLIKGLSGNDTLTGGTGCDTIYGGDGNDTAYGGSGSDYLDGGNGNDVLFGGDDCDTLVGGCGDDTLYGGAGNDRSYGGEGRDTLHADGGNDQLYGGEDSDAFVIDKMGAIKVVGGEDCDHRDMDVLKLGTPNADWDHYQVFYGGGNDEAGTVKYYDTHGHVVGTVEFKEIEKVICFTPGTPIATPTGEIEVQDLRVGDRVFTRDNGAQEICWIGTKTLSAADIARQNALRPVLIRAGSLGNDLPERDIMVSPSHRMLITSDQARIYFDEREVLVAAKHLVGRPGIERAPVAPVSYIHFMCQHHEVVLASGVWSESFQPGDQAMSGLAEAQRRELYSLFPELQTDVGITGFIAARRTLKRHEARLLVG